MPKLKEEELAKQLKMLLTDCVGFDGDELQTTRRQAYDYYFQRKRGDEIPGRSEIVTGDVSAMIEGNLAQMIGPLLNKRIAEFCAYDAIDEEQAQAESDCIHSMLFRRQNGFIEVSSAIKDMLLLRNGVVKIYVDTRTHVQQIRKSNVEPEIITDVLDQIGKVDVHSYDPKTKKLSATLTKTTKKFRVEALAPENFLYPKDWHRQDLEGIPFCAERHVEPRSTLIERGFDKTKVAALPRWNNPYQASSDARLPRNMSPSSMPIDTSQEKIEWYEAYVRVDDGTGAGELRRVCFSGTTILEDEDADVVCYATGVAIINPHTFMGISLFDKLKSVQDSSTALNRALQDNLNTTNKNRTAHFDGLVEADDLTDGRTNGSIRVKPGMVPDVRMAVAAFEVPDTSGNILANIEHMRRVRSEMGGATLDMATGQMQLNDRVGSEGLDRAYSVMEMLAEFMTRMAAHTLIRQMYIVAHEVLRTQWTGPLPFKRGKAWLIAEPNKWPIRDEIEVNMGMSKGERQRMSMILEAVMGKQAALAEHGMEDVLVDVDAYYQAFMEWMRVNDVDMPERFALDPKSDRGKQALKDKATQSAQQSQKQDALLQQAIALEHLRQAFEKYKTDSELQFKYYDTAINAQIEEAKISTNAVVDLTKAKATAAAAAKQGNGNGQGSTKEGGNGTESESSAG